MKFSSPDFSEGGNIPERFTCDGKDISPTLKIDDVPKRRTGRPPHGARSERFWKRKLRAIRYLEWVAGEGFKDGKSRSRPAALR